MQFYIPNLNAKTLTEEQSAHLFVMRVQEGKVYKATNLEGRVGQFKITKVDKKTKTIDFEQSDIPKQIEFKPKLMFQAIPDKVYLNKLCEVLPLSGVTDLYLFYSDFSIQYPINMERISKILIRSCEQGEVAYLPKITVLNKKDLDIELKKHLPIVLDCGVSQIPHQSPDPTSPAVEESMRPAIIGPEGGWSQEEITYFKSLNLPFQSLGSMVYPAWIVGLIFSQSQN
jgi:RsmE family RNA methyltransferase